MEVYEDHNAEKVVVLSENTKNQLILQLVKFKISFLAKRNKM